MKKIKSTIKRKYALIRRDDLAVIVEMDHFPDSERAIMYRNGNKVIFLPMRASDIMGDDKLAEELRIRAVFQ
ncbi:TPA: hypothetical protein ACP4T9_001279 [Escherichia coli]|uniref:hypothetical protein n=1 Tax=Escherichia coli TaxID=562 RepID=UPI00135DFE13|nr:hypothetical protein [Escherichia coli]EFJ3514919.1 hypothetical protein [Escherichia coli]EJC6351660.1 hypothetical protein [Escherichia coli]MDC8936282.1 hypothetical protein [Escherichia coli]MXD00784.1 hypothetical protein [Escherichia coli]MXE28538.1 hypothetical protein [Escherichia coli]